MAAKFKRNFISIAATKHVGLTQALGGPDTMRRPLLPKRLAARIRAAQDKVLAARYNIIHDDERIAQHVARIAEYEADPAAFASRYYGNNPHTSYPIQTNISRCRESLERCRTSRPRQIEELVAAEESLGLTEEQMLQEVNRMRPDTPGRVPWPRALRGLEKLRHISTLINKREEREYQRQSAIDEAEFEAHLKEEESAARLEDEASLQEWQEHLAKMAPHERDAEKKAADKLLEALKSGEITAAQVIEYVRARRSAT